MSRLLKIRRSSGVTLIELMIAIAILGILMAIALPNYATWIQNTQIRTAAESILTGLQKARVEAARRNTVVRFSLTDGTGWNITVVNDASLIEDRPASDGSVNIALTVDAPDGATTVDFNGLARVNNVGEAIEQITLTSTAIADSKRRPLQINIGAGGIIRLCDPAVSNDTDPRKCQ